MGLRFLGLSAVGWQSMTNSWWEQILGIFLLATTVAALLYVLFWVIRLATRRYKQSRHGAPVPRPVARHLKGLKREITPITTTSSPEEREATVPQSFGVFLGTLSSSPTIAQQRLLSQWDILVVDPLQDGVLSALASCPPTSAHVLARLDVCALVKVAPSDKNADVIRNLDIVVDAASTCVVSADGQPTPFSGILLVKSNRYFQPAVLNELARVIHGLGLNVWLELSYPDYLTEDEACAIDMTLFHGLVYRNGMTRPDGDRQNYFQMSAMRSIMRAVAAQCVGQHPQMAMWETIDDEAEVEYAVVARTHKLCTFYNAVAWIGHANALTDAEAAEARTLATKPLGALMWLKDEDNMAAHSVWRANDHISQAAAGHDALYGSLASFIPNLSSRLRLHRPTSTQVVKTERPASQAYTVESGSSQSLLRGFAAADPLATSSKGEPFTGLGCFQLGHEPTYAEFAELRESQRKLEDLGLLSRVKGDELAEVHTRIAALGSAGANHKNLGVAATQVIDDLLDLLSATDLDGDDATRLKVFSGLHSAFLAQESGAQYWGLYHVDCELEPVCTILYLSNEAGDRASAILHTYMSSRECSRTECLLAEQALADVINGPRDSSKLFPRLERDVEQLTPSEAILLLERLQSSSQSSSLVPRICDLLEYQLMDMPSLAQQRALASTAYLGGKISMEHLVSSRLSWLSSKGCFVPDVSEAVAVFDEVQSRLYTVLMAGESDVYAQLGTAMQALFKGQIDAGADVLALAIFCAFRKFALDEVYLEVLDRNAYPNHSPDQPGVFSEHFALGSRCDSFFDTTARSLGRIIAGRYRGYYNKYQPPRREEGFTELPTTYAAMGADFDPNDGYEPVPFYHKVTFFGIFAVPALFDVMLLTTIGRGLFLTTFMTSEQKIMATTGLLIALLIAGAFGAWICSGGSYYFFASAFPAMNLFVLTRFVAGLAFTILVALIGFISFLVTRGVTAALTFAFYLTMLATYMQVLSALSIYQLSRSSFLSGRTAILTCVPILFASPVITIFTGHDIVVYVTVLSTFLLAILVSAWRIIGGWSSWYLKIPFITDIEVVRWYRESTEASSVDLGKMSEAAVMHRARMALQTAVVKETHRSVLSKRSPDPIVARLASGYKPSMFLMQWYSMHRRSRLPLAYSTTWNLMMKAAMENMTNMQKGLKLHSAFLHWRTTGLDIWAGCFYFVVALTDKWVTLFTSGNIVGLSAAGNIEFRLGVGWGLCYYLMGALMLDIISQPLWVRANDKTTMPIQSLEHLGEVVKLDASSRRRLYWTKLTKLFFFHLWAMVTFTALMWAFQDSKDNTIMFLGYVGAYSGLLFYQYNKIFCGNDGAVPLAVGATVGLPLGLVLQIYRPQFVFSGPISLAAATWTSGFLAFGIAMLGPPSIQKPKSSPAKGRKEAIPRSYSVTTLELKPDISQTTMRQLFDAARRLSPERCLQLDPSQHPGSRVVSLLSARNPRNSPAVLTAAFPSAEKLIQAVTKLWQDGRTTVELVSSRDVPRSQTNIRAICRKSPDSLHIFVMFGPDRIDEWTLNVARHWKIIAETIVHATAEHWMGMSHNDALLASLLVVDHASHGELSIPECVKYQLEFSSKERARFVRGSDKSLLGNLLLGVDTETEWEELPPHIRSFLLRRLRGLKPALSADVEGWLLERLDAQDSRDVDAAISRFELGAALTKEALNYANDFEFNGQFEPETPDIMDAADESHGLLSEWTVDDKTRSKITSLKAGFLSIVYSIKTSLKFLVISLTADPEYQRELDFVIHDKPALFRWPVAFFLNSIWSYCHILQTMIVPIVLFHGRDQATNIQKMTRGNKTVLEKKRIVAETLSGQSTWFWAVQQDGTIRISQYSDRHDAEPSDRSKLIAINTYTDSLVLQQREVYKKGSLANSFRYEYQDGNLRLPIQRECTEGEQQGEIVQYDHRGYVTTGSATRDLNRVTFKYWYRKDAKYEDELLWAEYTFGHITIKVLWSMPPRNPQTRLEEWIPFSTVTEATFIQGEDTYHASWDYEHKFHPEVAVTLNGTPVPPPPMIKYDWFRVLKKPDSCSFLVENPLLSFSSIKTTALSRFLGFNVRRYPIPTSAARTQLWQAWRNGRDVDAVSARWLDEKLVRADAITRPYWRLRDFGLLGAAKAYLDTQADAIMARVDVDPQTSSWTHLAFKIADLYSFGQGGDARINTRKLESQLLDGPEELHVLAMDTSTWPNDPGGVSNCRRDMINNLESIRWHVLAESANDYGVPRFQIERNVHSLTVLPLWGLDFLNPTHGVLETQLDSAVVQRSNNTKAADIERNFLPILDSLVRCSRAIKHTRQHIEEATKALVDLNTYFESSRNWTDVWNHPVVKRRWCELWLSEDMSDNAVTISQWWDFEKPTIKHLEDALSLWTRYLFIINLPVPEQIPEVFQASHHFCGAMYGIVCKVKRGCSLHIWDHCISYREFITFMSSAVSFDLPFVNSSLISLTHLSCVLLEYHADVVLPCCDYFNPGWEVELGTAEGALQHRREFARKICPVVNGISNMEKFKPIQTIETETPTVVMLSHVQFFKNIKNAILACDIIVNKWGFRDYKLEIYGDQERAATLATECQEIIAAKNLQDNCRLMGLGKPDAALERAWLFLNSSISEGLPLAMGEAALMGVPIVCTDVGASYCVVTDSQTGLRFSEVVPPNDAESLARAQVSVLAMLGPWSAYAEDSPDAAVDVPVLEYPTPSRESVRRISERMYAKTEQRRALGLRGRQNVLNSFSDERYLREHEQMLWIGKARSGTHRARAAAVAAARGALGSSGVATATPGTEGSSLIQAPRPAYAMRSPRVSRLTPESWVSLASEKTGRSWWKSSSTLAGSTAGWRDKDNAGPPRV